MTDVPANIELKAFPTVEKAHDYLFRERRFDKSSEKYVPIEDFEWIFLWEYQHSRDKTMVARICDLTTTQRKVKDSDRLPELFGFVQVAIKIEEADQLQQ